MFVPMANWLKMARHAQVTLGIATRTGDGSTSIKQNDSSASNIWVVIPQPTLTLRSPPELVSQFRPCKHLEIINPTETKLKISKSSVH